MELKDTVELMNSQDYKERFKAEYLQLKIRKEKLSKLIIKQEEEGKISFEPTCSIWFLKMQESIMEDYLDVLERRAKLEKINLKEKKKSTSKEAVELARIEFQKDIDDGDENNEWLKRVIGGLKEAEKDLEILELLKELPWEVYQNGGGDSWNWFIDTKQSFVIDEEKARKLKEWLKNGN